MRRNRVQKGKGYVGVAIVIPWFNGNGEFKSAAAFGSGVSRSRFGGPAQCSDESGS